MKTTTSSKLKEARDTATLIRFSRRFELSPIHGYVVDVGPRFFLLLVVSDRIWFDGFQCFRIEDVRGVRRDPDVDFIETALRRRRERVAKAPPISVASTRDILLSGGRAFPLVTIHRERVDPDVCHIGSVRGVTRTGVSLLQIQPGAIWDLTPTEYRLGEITRVDFGGDYENALLLVGGRAPKASRRLKPAGTSAGRPPRAPKSGRSSSRAVRRV